MNRQRLAWRWVITDIDDCLNFLSAIYPFLIEKHEQAKIMVNYLNMYRDYQKSEIKLRYILELDELGEQLYKRLKELKTFTY